MRISAGSRVGPYSVLGPLGAGGMGEVYRAQDPRLGREVAIKVLPDAVATDPERLRRFEQEARAAGALSHPNVQAVFDVGLHDGLPFLVSELLEGETLRERLRSGGLTHRKAVEYGMQVAQGLAAAHAKGIVHRDIKPENLFVTSEGRVKILDFGLAKLRPLPDGSALAEDDTASQITRPGAVMGTAAYMSPEQARGLPAGPASDIFSLGVVLYEMLSRRRPFRGETTPQVLSAILTEDPPELPSIDASIPPALDRLVRRCLEKQPQDRFQSAHDLALALESVAGSATGAAIVPGAAARSPRLLAVAVAVASLVLGAGLALLPNLFRGAPPAPRFQQLSFRRGAILNARFAPDSQTVIYSAAWDGQPARIYSTRIGGRESRALDLPEGKLLSVSSRGDLALKLGRFYGGGGPGTLARAALAGGAPRELATDVLEADWTPDGEELAVLRLVGGRRRLEWPMPRVVYEPAGPIGSIRCLLDGEHVAMVERLPEAGRAPFSVTLVDRQGRRTVLSKGWSDIWNIGGSVRVHDEVWFAAAGRGVVDYALRGATLAGAERLVGATAGDFFLSDVDERERVLLVRGTRRWGMFTRAGEAPERDLAWLDYSQAADISADGRTLLFNELGGGAAETGAVCLRKMDGSPVVQLGEGSALSLSPDGHSVLSLPSPVGLSTALVLTPTGAGTSRSLRDPSIRYYFNGRWLPDGKAILVVGGEDERHARLYAWSLEGGGPRAVSAEGFSPEAGIDASPDGRWVAGKGAAGLLVLYSLGGDLPRDVPGSRAGDEVVRWSADGRWLYVMASGSRPCRVDRLNVASGERRVWRELMPPDPTGMTEVDGVVMTPDGQAYAYRGISSLGSLYLAEDLR